MTNFERYSAIMQTVKNFRELAKANSFTDIKSVSNMVYEAIYMTYDDMPECDNICEADIALIFWIILRGDA